MWTTVLNLALPPQRHSPDAWLEHQEPVIHMAQNKRETRKKERKKRKGKERKKERKKERRKERKKKIKNKVIKIKNNKY